MKNKLNKKIIGGVLAFLCACVVVTLVAGVAVSLLGMWGMVVAEALLIVVAILFAKWEKAPISERLSLNLPTIGSFFRAIPLFFGVYLAQSGFMSIIYALTGAVNETDSALFDTVLGSISPRAALIIIAVVPAVCEEIFFRGYILNSFITKKGKAALAVVVSSLLFAAVHFDAVKLVPAFVMGLGMGYVAYKTGSVLLSLIFHFINNSLSVISYYSSLNTEYDGPVMVISRKGYLFAGFAVIFFASIFVYYGIKNMEQKKVRRFVSVIVTLALLFAAGGSAALVAYAEGELVYNNTEEFKIYDTETSTKTITIDRNTQCMPMCSVYSDTTLEWQLEIKDEEGKTLSTLTNESASYEAFIMRKGTYTLTLEISLPEEQREKVGEEYVRAYTSVMLYTIGELQFEE